MNRRVTGFDSHVMDSGCFVRNGLWDYTRRGRKNREEAAALVWRGSRLWGSSESDKIGRY